MDDTSIGKVKNNRSTGIVGAQKGRRKPERDTKTILPPTNRKEIDGYTIEQLVETLETKEQAIFFYLWLKHGRNATNAYMEYNPKCTSRKVATMNGYRMLSQIPRKVVMRSYLDAYGLNEKLYFDVLGQGLDARSYNLRTHQYDKDFKTIKQYHDKLGELLEIEKQETKTPTQGLNITITTYNERPVVEGEVIE